jgi:hypothetical protein
MENIVTKPNYRDFELTAGALAGHRDAFAQIVTHFSLSQSDSFFLRHPLVEQKRCIDTLSTSVQIPKRV